MGDLAALTARLEALTPLAQARRAESEQAAREARERGRSAADHARRGGRGARRAGARADPLEGLGRPAARALRGVEAQQRREPPRQAHRGRALEAFSHARTTFDRKRRQHFGALDEQRAQARAAKERLIARAEELSTSTDWAATANAFRDLMTEWKAAGRTARKDDDALWARFRAAQDAFFAARTAANDQVGRRVPGEPAGEGGAAGGGRASGAGPRRAGGPGGPARHPGPLGGRRQGAARRPGPGRGRGCARSSRPSATPSRSAGPAATRRRAHARRMRSTSSRARSRRCARGWTRPAPAAASERCARPSRRCRPARSGSSRPARRWRTSAADPRARPVVVHRPRRRLVVHRRVPPSWWRPPLPRHDGGMTGGGSTLRGATGGPGWRARVTGGGRSHPFVPTRGRQRSPGWSPRATCRPVVVDVHAASTARPTFSLRLAALRLLVPARLAEAGAVVCLHTALWLYAGGAGPVRVDLALAGAGRRTRAAEVSLHAVAYGRRRPVGRPAGVRGHVARTHGRGRRPRAAAHRRRVRARSARRRDRAAAGARLGGAGGADRSPGGRPCSPCPAGLGAPVGLRRRRNPISRRSVDPVARHPVGVEHALDPAHRADHVVEVARGRPSRR